MNRISPAARLRISVPLAGSSIGVPPLEPCPPLARHSRRRHLPALLAFEAGRIRSTPRAATSAECWAAGHGSKHPGVAGSPGSPRLDRVGVGPDVERRRERLMPSRPNHFEIPVDDPDRAERFYGAVFGWTFERFDGAPSYYGMATTGETQPGINGALFQRGTDGETAITMRSTRSKTPSPRSSRKAGRSWRGRRHPGHGLLRHVSGHGGEQVRPLHERPERHDGRLSPAR